MSNLVQSTNYFSVLPTLFPSCVMNYTTDGAFALHPLYRAMWLRWEKVCYLNGGTEAMREAGTKYLPREPGEDVKDYERRLCRSTCYGVYSKTIKYVTDLPFITPAIIENFPPELEYLIEDADGQGTPIDVFAKSILNDLLNFGVAHIFVDYPSDTADLNYEEEQEYQIRPYFCRISPLNLIRWRLKREHGKVNVEEISIFEEAINYDSQSTESSDCGQVVTVTKDKYTIYQGDQLISETENTLGMIPLVSLYANRKAHFYGTPVYEELAEQNIQHWYKSSDLNNIEHIACVPFLFGPGMGDAEIEHISPGMLIKSKDVSAQLSWVEVTGNAIPSLEENLGALESRMIAMGADALLPVKTATRQTAAGEVIDEKKSASLLTHLVIQLEHALVKATGLAAKWLKKPEPKNLIINIGDKLALTVEPNQVTSFIDMLEKEIMTAKDLTHELRRRNIISENTVLRKPRKPVKQPKEVIPDAGPSRQQSTAAEQGTGSTADDSQSATTTGTGES